MYLSTSNKTKAAGYFRLSREDGDRIESDSIVSQRDLVRDYVKDRAEIALVEEYIDDGYSGTNFDRPAFKKLMKDIESKKINCVIVKDLSRLGRNYIETGKYLERVFPVMGVRFIAINDRYDSFDSNNDSDQVLIPFKNLINDAYCRDISMKIRSQLEVKRKRGQFTGSFAGYGYCKDPKDKNHLIIDEDAAEIVRLIFRMKLDGYSAGHIAESLNEANVVTPMEYKILSGLNYRSGFRSGSDPKWTHASVLRILRNELYTGVTIQGRRRKVNYKVKMCLDVPEQDWVKVENTHDAIIPQIVFDNVQEMLRRDTRTSPDMDKVYLFSGYLRCPDCGQSLVRRTVKKGKRKYHYYHCSTYMSGNGCSSHLISEKKLSDAVLASIQKQVALVVKASELIEQNEESETVRPGIRAANSQIDTLLKEVRRYSSLMAQLYQDRHEGVIGEVEYKDINARFQEKIAAAKEALEQAEKKRDCLLASETIGTDWIELFKEHRNIQKLDRKTVVSLIDHIDIYDKDHIEIQYRYSDELLDIASWSEARTDEMEEEVMNQCGA